MNANTVSQDVKNFFDGYADAFDAIYENDLTAGSANLSHFLRQSMWTRFEHTFTLCRPLAGHTFLDLGCGGAQYSGYAAQQGADHVTGVDISEEMIAMSKRRAQEKGVADRCEFVVGDVLECKDIQPHDYVVALGVFDYIENPEILVRRMGDLAKVRMVASFPKRHHWLAPQRKVRYRLRNCPLYLYSKGDLEKLGKDLGPKWAVHIFDLGRDYLFTAAAP